MKKKARVIMTLDCNRGCPGCGNTLPTSDVPIKIASIDDVLEYDEIILTGGEPMLHFDELFRVAERIKMSGVRETPPVVYLYTALLGQGLQTLWSRRLIDGIHFTLHDGCSDKDIRDLKQLSWLLQYVPLGFSSRLAIDSRVYDKYDLSNIDFRNWDVIRRLQWLTECPIPKDEELFIIRS